MYLNHEDFSAAASAPWDLIVVGAGAVGLILAVSLTMGKRRVLLLESGTHEPAGADDLNEVMVTGRVHDGAQHGRGRTIGGTTTLWGGQLTRFVPYDFERRDFSGDCEWPIEFEVLGKYYAEVAGMLGLDARYLGDESVRLALKAKPFDERSACEVFFTRWLREPNLARVFAAELESRESLAVAPGCHATQVLSEPDGRITGVKAVDRLGVAHRFDAGGVVLACGTIEISRLLLLTRKKDQRLEWAKNPNVGRYFQDHVDLVIGRIESRNRRAFSDIFENVLIDGHKYMPKIKMRASILRDSGALNIAGTARFDSSLSEDIALLKTFIKSLMRGAKIENPWQTIRRMGALGRIWFPLIWRYLRHRRILAIADRGISVIAHCEQRPIGESRITLDAARVDRFGDSIAHLHWVIDEELQISSLQFFARQLEHFLKTECDAELRVVPELLAGDHAVLSQARDSYHQCGGARMAADASEGVVDSDCKVFGTENLYIAGAAVFPTSSFANPTFTAMALARRLSDHLSDVA